MKKKILMTCLCVALAVLTIAGTTLAYLTSHDTVTNTFTVGNVTITLDEAKVNADGTAVTPAERVKENSYKLMPGHTYTKDPTVHVAAGSEASWIFVKVENGIAAFEDSEGNTIAKQIATTNGWTALEGVADVYYKEYTSTTATDLVVFNNFKMSDAANGVDGWGDISVETTKVTVTAYAVQKDGFDTAKAAWDATFGQPAGN